MLRKLENNEQTTQKSIFSGKHAGPEVSESVEVVEGQGTDPEASQEEEEVDLADLLWSLRSKASREKRLYESVTPIGYDTKHAIREYMHGKHLPFTWDKDTTHWDTFQDLDRWKNPKTGEQGWYGQYAKDASMDAWGIYLNQGQKNETFTKTGENTYRFNQEDDIIDDVMDRGVLEDPDTTSYIEDSGAGGFVLKNYRIDKGYDKETDTYWFDYKDEYDFDIPLDKVTGGNLKSVPGEYIAGKPFNIEGRIYYKKLKNGDLDFRINDQEYTEHQEDYTNNRGSNYKRGGRVNPWAICTKSAGRKDKAKYERCVMKVKRKHGISYKQGGPSEELPNKYKYKGKDKEGTDMYDYAYSLPELVVEARHPAGDDLPYWDQLSNEERQHLKDVRSGDLPASPISRSIFAKGTQGYGLTNPETGKQNQTFSESVDEAGRLGAEFLGDAMLEGTGVPALYRTLSHPVESAKSIGKTALDIATIGSPIGWASEAYKRYNNPEHIPFWTGHFEQEDVMNTLDALSLIPAAGLAGKGLKATGKGFRSALYKGIDPMGYGVREKIKQFPRKFRENTRLSANERAMKIGEEWVDPNKLNLKGQNLDEIKKHAIKGTKPPKPKGNTQYTADGPVDPKAYEAYQNWQQSIRNIRLYEDALKKGQSRLDAWSIALGKKQNWNTFTPNADGSYRLTKMYGRTPEGVRIMDTGNLLDHKPDIYFQNLLSDLEAARIAQQSKRKLGEESFYNQLRNLNKKHWNMVTRESREKMNKMARTGNFDEMSDIPVDHMQYLFQRGTFVDEAGSEAYDILMKQPKAWSIPYEQRSIVRGSHKKGFDQSVFDIDDTGVMGQYRWDVSAPNKQGHRTFQYYDRWDLHPLQQRGNSLSGHITGQGSGKYHKYLPESIRNLEMLKLVGGKPFDIRGNYIIDDFSGKVLKANFKKGGRIKRI